MAQVDTGGWRSGWGQTRTVTKRFESKWEETEMVGAERTLSLRGTAGRGAHHDGFTYPPPPIFSAPGFGRIFQHGVFATSLYMVTQLPTEMA